MSDGGGRPPSAPTGATSKTSSEASSEAPSGVQSAAGDQLSARHLYDLLRLRVDVFVVEQSCPYHEIDGLDLLPTTQHLWLADEQGPTATIRLLDVGSPMVRIGRVATRPDCRRQGLAQVLIEHGLQRLGPVATRLDAQSHLAPWYERFGYQVEGSEYLEDGIPHLPMIRPAGDGNEVDG